MSNLFEVSGRGLSRVAGAGKDLPEPTVLLDLTAKPGDTWKAADGQ
ncbi:MAG TPA: hypothetical protein VM597_24665 [Gemmataceae bacterium]|nr:hypothetical protein [Gemmataceae bacterium]